MANEKDNTLLPHIAKGTVSIDIPDSVLVSQVVELQKQENLPSGILVDASVGKILYFNNRAQSLNINLTATNILNNTKMITGGYQQARIPLNSSKDIDVNGLGKFPNKYYYAQGFNFFVNLGYRF